jgi:hypothetical protein
MNSDLKLKAGEWVVIRSKEEILRTLDGNGQLDGLPFMPQMLQYCGQRFQVFRRSHKTCDTVTLTGGRRMEDAYHLLGMRCDGQAYGGCQAGCLMFWKGVWLKREGEAGAPPTPAAGPGCTEAEVLAGTRVPGQKPDEEPRWVCQITQLPKATTVLPWWKFSQYVEDVSSGNISAGRLLRGLIYLSYYRLVQSGIGLGEGLRWIYDRFQGLIGGVPYPRRFGKIPLDKPTPHATLGLEVGEWVRVKPYQEILATLNEKNKNRGLLFDAEMVPYCGGSYRVLRRVNQILDEGSGRMLKIKNDCIVLEEVYCQGRYGDCRYCPSFCPRAIYSYWREIWLERTSAPAPRR